MIKLEQAIFYIFVFCLPFQTRLILQRWTRPFNEWTASFLYGTDILLVLVLLFWLIRAVRKKIRPKLGLNDWLLVSFFVVSAISVINAEIMALSFYRLLKLGEFISLYFYIKSSANKIFTVDTFALVIFGSGLIQAVIAIGQYLKQGSLGLKILGESHIGIDISNVAVFVAAGQKYLRGYGTTPHPNVLAAWLLLSLFAFYFLYSAGKLEYRRWPWLMAYGLVLFGFFFTYSRVIIGVWLLAGIMYVLLARHHLKTLLPIILSTLLACFVFALLYWPQVLSRIHISADEEAVTQRLAYNKIAQSVSQANPLLGIGLGQFVGNLMQKYKHYPAIFYQPVHNIYLLISSETGYVGLGTFLLFLLSLFIGGFRKIKSFAFLAFGFSFLLIGFFDHFLWTLQQGSLLFWSSLAMMTLNELWIS